jgi:GNAT superfamily N-acetyltransferase
VAKTDIGIEIEIAVSDEQILATYGVMSQLRPHLQAAEYVGIVRMQQAESGYKLAALKENGRVTSVAGFRISHSLATGKYLYLDDLVTDQDRRSQGAGRVLFHWLVLQARNGQCRVLHLDSGVQRHHAHRFYLHERMDIVSYHFCLKLSPAVNG